MVRLYVPVYLDILEVLQHAGQSVWLARNALKMRHAAIKNAETLVLEHVELEQSVRSSTTIRFAVVQIV